MMDKYVLRNTMLDLLLRIEQGSGYSHLLINQELKTRNIPEKDRRLLTEVVYGTTQRKITLDYYLNQLINPNKKQKQWVITLLRMSLYQMFFLDKIPDHAIIHEAVEIAKQRGHKGIASFVNGVLRSAQRQGIPDMSMINDTAKRLSIETSHPEWLVEQWLNDYGYETTEAMCFANLKHKPISVRIQPLKISREEALTTLTQEGLSVEPSVITNQGIIVKEGDIFQSTLFKQGYLTVQDQTSMLVGDMIDARPGMQVMDTCSAPGGKVTHLAEKMADQGHINAHDLHDKKVNLIKEKAKQLSLSIIEASQGDARQLSEKYTSETFDRILVDAPCTGFGVVRGKPEIKYNKVAKDIDQLAKIQLEILNSVAPLLKKGGYLLYSTCTVNTIENEGVIQSFLKNNPEYNVDQDFFDELPEVLKNTVGKTNYGLQIFPQTYQTDGFFLTRLKK